MKKILFTGGGSGGHIFPIIAIVREIKKISPSDMEIYYIGPKDKFGFDLLSKEGVKVKTITTGKLRRYWNPKSALQNLIDIIFKMPLGLLKSFFLLFFIAPDIIFSKGGYGSLPVVISGWILRIPTFLHESDTVPGLANKIASKFALEVFVSFSVRETENLPKEKMFSIGNPIRRELLGGSFREAKEIFNLSGEKPVILVLGGSQGAQKINDAILGTLPDILRKFEIIHQCGKRNFKEVLSQTEFILQGELKKYYHLFDFLDEEKLKNAYFASDLVISRAGSGAIFEIAALAKPSILVPISASPQNHQLKNAYAYARAKATVLIEEVNLKPHFLIEKLNYLFSHPEELNQMAQEAKKFSRPKSALIIARYLVNYLRLRPVD
jgi:UDP-N-acetylglucosamine--N-acetylmuramyl-(pentapeptide) pyrophosphoryl-undecaprenol N-acetylglucosamine transferase